MTTPRFHPGDPVRLIGDDQSRGVVRRVGNEFDPRDQRVVVAWSSGGTLTHSHLTLPAAAPSTWCNAHHPDTLMHLDPAPIGGAA